MVAPLVSGLILAASMRMGTMSCYPTTISLLKPVSLSSPSGRGYWVMSSVSYKLYSHTILYEYYTLINIHTSARRPPSGHLKSIAPSKSSLTLSKTYLPSPLIS